MSFFINKRSPFRDPPQDPASGPLNSRYSAVPIPVNFIVAEIGAVLTTVNEKKIKVRAEYRELIG
jgi:hypothetical protein